MASVRRIASDLRPPVLDDLGLLGAVDWLADALHHRYGVDVSARLEIGDLMFSDAAAMAIFRIVQEALNNVAKHVQASEVTLEMTCSGSMCALSIKDDGQGVPLLAPRSEKSFGLLGMHERAIRWHRHYRDRPGPRFSHLGSVSDSCNCCGCYVPGTK
jgi:signal transduction histidine kinase